MTHWRRCPIGWRIKPRARIAHFWEGEQTTCGERFDSPFIDDFDEVQRAREPGVTQCPRCMERIHAVTEWAVDVTDYEANQAAAPAGVNHLVGSCARVIMYGLTLERSCYRIAAHMAVFGGWRFASVYPVPLTGYDSDSDRYPAAVERVLADLPQPRAGEMPARDVLRAVFDAHPEGVSVLSRPGVSLAGWFWAVCKVNTRALVAVGRPLIDFGPNGRLVVAEDVPDDIVEARAQAAEREAGLAEKARRRQAARRGGSGASSARPKPSTHRAIDADDAPPKAPRRRRAPDRSTTPPEDLRPMATDDGPGGRDPEDVRTIDLEERVAACATRLGRRVLDGIDAWPSGGATVLSDGRVVSGRRPGVPIVVAGVPGGGTRGWLGAEAIGDGLSLERLAVEVVARLDQQAIDGFEHELLGDLAPVRAVGVLRGGRVLDRSRPGGHKVRGLTWEIDEVGPESPFWRPARCYTALRVEASRADGGWVVAAVAPDGMYCPWMVKGIPLAYGLMRLRAWLAGVAGCGLPPPLSEAAMAAELRGAPFDPVGVVDAVRRAAAPAVAAPEALAALPASDARPGRLYPGPLGVEFVFDYPDRVPDRALVIDEALVAQRLLDQHRPGWHMCCVVRDRDSLGSRGGEWHVFWYLLGASGALWSHQGLGLKLGPLGQVFRALRQPMPGWIHRQGPVIALGCDPRPLALPAPGDESAGRCPRPRRARTRAARVHAALQRHGLQLGRCVFPPDPESGLDEVIYWTALDAEGDPAGVSKTDPVRTARDALSWTLYWPSGDPIALQPPWVVRWDGALTHDAMPGPRSAFASITMAGQIGAWLDAIALQFPRLRKLGTPGCSKGWVTWGRSKPDVLGGYVQIVYDPPTAHGNLDPARPAPPEGVVGAYVRLGDAVVEVPEPCPHLLAIAAARLAALALGGVDQRGGRSDAEHDVPEGTRTQTERQPTDQAAAGRGSGLNHGVELVLIAEPRAAGLARTPPPAPETTALAEQTALQGASTAPPRPPPTTRLEMQPPTPPAGSAMTAPPLPVAPASQTAVLRGASPARARLAPRQRRAINEVDAAARVLAWWQSLVPKTGRRPKVEPEVLLAIRARLIADGEADDDAAVARVASTRYGKRVSRLAVFRAHATARERLDAIADELDRDTVVAAVHVLGWAPRWPA